MYKLCTAFAWYGRLHHIALRMSCNNRSFYDAFHLMLAVGRLLSAYMQKCLCLVVQFATSRNHAVAQPANQSVGFNSRLWLQWEGVNKVRGLIWLWQNQWQLPEQQSYTMYGSNQQSWNRKALCHLSTVQARAWLYSAPTKWWWPTPPPSPYLSSPPSLLSPKQ